MSATCRTAPIVMPLCVAPLLLPACRPMCDEESLDRSSARISATCLTPPVQQHGPNAGRSRVAISTTNVGQLGTIVSRYNWHSAGSLACPIPMLKFKYIFQINIRKQFYQTALGNCNGLKLTKCWLQFKTRGKVRSWKYRSPRKRNSRPPASVILC